MRRTNYVTVVKKTNVPQCVDTQNIYFRLDAFTLTKLCVAQTSVNFEMWNTILCNVQCIIYGFEKYKINAHMLRFSMSLSALLMPFLLLLSRFFPRVERDECWFLATLFGWKAITTVDSGACVEFDVRNSHALCDGVQSTVCNRLFLVDICVFHRRRFRITIFLVRNFPSRTNY